MTAKRLAIVLALACAFTMMFAGVAFAAAGALSSGIAGVDPYAASPGGTPHTGYLTTTVKCAVCHAVHRANTTGQLLLRSTVAGACEYCHITGNVATKLVYNSDAATYYTPDLETNHSGNTGSTCVNCHAVHGAGAISTTGAGDINEKILKSTLGVQSGLPATWSFTAGSVRDGVVSAFCTQCHPYWTDQYDMGAGTMHVMGAASADYKSKNASSTVAASTTVAWAASTFCRSCHDAGFTDQAGGGNKDNNFPHYTKGAARFLLSALNYSVISTATGAADPSQDGACLKCHAQNNTTGVGFSY